MPKHSRSCLFNIKSRQRALQTNFCCYKIHSKLPAHLVRFPAGTLAWVLVLLMASGVTLSPQSRAVETRPLLMLSNNYHSGVALTDYWISEKYDGVRGYWDGEKLLTRGGQAINAPAWFTAGWPKTPLDGELWVGRGQFSTAMSTVRRLSPDDAAWRGRRFVVFDLPADPGVFNDRLLTLNKLVAQLAQPWVQSVAQNRMTGHPALQARLLQTVRTGGEGLVLHRGASLYRSQRSDDLLKLKTHDDAEARVVAHLPGKDKFAGRLGA